MSNQLPKYGAISVEMGNDISSSDTVLVAESNKAPRKGILRGGLFLCTTALLLVVSRGAGGQQQSHVPMLSSHLTKTTTRSDGNEPMFYNEQLVDHFGQDNDDDSSTWSHRYYKATKYFGGAGSPIFLVVGGEGALNNGMLYPFVTEHLARRFGAAVIQPEHRFYGPYQPIEGNAASTDELLQLLTPQQAMADMLRLVNVHLHETDFKDCSLDRSSPSYCPLITIGGSYPGFLSAMFRLVHSDVVDAAYASAAPLLMYAQVPDNTVYYDIVMEAAEHLSPGCKHSVKTTLTDVANTILSAPSLHEGAARVGVCPESIPKDVKTKQELADTVVMIATYSFANYDMGCYPPGPDNGLYKICQVFQDPELDSIETMKSFFNSMLIQDYEDEAGCDLATVHCDPKEELEAIRERGGEKQCFDIDDEVDDNSDANKEVYDGRVYDDSRSWDFQTCTNVIFLAGLSNTSMFPAHKATYEELAMDCQSQFGVTPRPRELADLWGFDDIKKAGASRILFTNGMLDMWSGGSITEDLSDSLLALNFENGAHHSDLSHEGPTDKDTDDIKQGYVEIAEILGKWISEIKSGTRDLPTQHTF